MVLNIAHRGACSLAPENTLAAARKALEVGADMWELDVAVTADGELIVFHDDSLARTTDAPTRFPDRTPWTFTTFTLAEIQTLDAGSWFVETDPFGQIAVGAVSPAEQRAYHGEKVLTLREALLFTQEMNWCVNVELKWLPSPLKDFPVAKQVLTLINELKIDKDRLAISSFDHNWLRKIQTQQPEIEVQALLGYGGTEPLAWGDLEFKSYNARYTQVDEKQIRALQEKDIPVNLWIVDEEKDMRRFIAAEAAGLITNFPQTLTALLQDIQL